MKQLNETLKGKIKEAIQNAEKNSSCEFVAIITQKSGNYGIYAFFVATISALLIPHLILWLTDWLTLGTIFRLQIVLFIVLMIVTRLPFIAKRLVPNVVMRRQATLVAQESFRKFGLHRTTKRRAILFFVSLDERYIEILTDTGIESKVSSEKWEPIIEKFSHHLHTKSVGEGYLEAIEACGEILKREFPAEAGDVDELPNELIIDQK
jgi:putative membrane protein